MNCQLLYIIAKIESQKSKLGNNNRFGYENTLPAKAPNGTRLINADSIPAFSKIKGIGIKINNITIIMPQFFLIWITFREIEPCQ